MRHSILVLQHGGHQRAVGPQLSRVLTPPKLKYVSPDALCKRDVTEVWFVAFAFTIRVSTGCSYPSARPRHRRGATVRAHQPHLFSPFTRFFHDFPLRGRTCVFWEAAAESLRQNYGSPSVRCERPFLVPCVRVGRALPACGGSWRLSMVSRCGVAILQRSQICAESGCCVAGNGGRNSRCSSRVRHSEIGPTRHARYTTGSGSITAPSNARSASGCGLESEPPVVVGEPAAPLSRSERAAPRLCDSTLGRSP
jgi:hypothetical protein